MRPLSGPFLLVLHQVCLGKFPEAFDSLVTGANQGKPVLQVAPN
jgi:NADPH-dependent curcumin reductase CurA